MTTGGTAKRPTGAWGWSAEPSTPKLEDSLGGATRRSLHISEYLPKKEVEQNMKVLVINAGSSSIKYQLYQMPESRMLAKGMVERIGDNTSQLSHCFGGESHSKAQPVPDHEAGMELILKILVDKEIGVMDTIQEIEAIGHRVVHGGEEFTGSVIITEAVVRSIEKFSDLAPLHNPPNLTGIRAAQHKLPQCVQVACFDTAFHSTIPEVAYTYALPHKMYEKFRIRRYGFHGTSHRYVARRAAEMLGVGKYEFDGITCHLGNGCSITAIRNGLSVDTSMGLTPLEGLVMGTRSGDFDPAILFYLADKGYDFDTLKNLCNTQSGMLGISGFSNDMRTLLTAASDGNPRAKLAIEVFSYRVRKYIGAYAAVLGRVGAIVFTGGIGENAAVVREQICQGMTPLGIKIDPEKNQTDTGRETDISDAASQIKILVIPTNEELAIAGDTYDLAHKNSAQDHTKETANLSEQIYFPKKNFNHELGKL
jgi:acetate kinase